MRVLIIGRTRPFSNEVGIQRELARRGHTSALVDDRRLRQAVQRRLGNLWMRARERAWRPEYLILQKSLDVDLPLLAEWCSRIPSVMWYRDLVIPPAEAMIARARHVDTVFLTPGGQAAEWQARGVRRVLFLPDAVDPWYDRPEPPHPHFACDIAFTGRGYDEERAELLCRLARRYHVRVWGRRWERWARELDWTRREAHGRDFGRVCSSAKVVLGIQPSFQVRAPVWGYQSNRMVRVLARGGFFVGHATPGLRHLFRDGEHCAWYDDEEQLLSQLDYYISRPEERSRIGRAGREFVLRHHTYAQRVDNLLTREEWRNPLPTDPRSRAGPDARTG